MKRNQTRSGFTLLEIVLALAILAGALAALGEVLRLASLNAEHARDESQAQLLASSVMAELVSGARQLTNVNQAELPIDAQPRWEYSIAIEETPYQELLLVRVQVAQQLPLEKQPRRFELVRWFSNPDYAVATSTASESDSQSSGSTTSADSSSGTSSSSSGTTNGGGR